MRSDTFELTINGSDVKFSGKNIPPIPTFVKLEKNPIVVDKNELNLKYFGIFRSPIEEEMLSRMRELYEWLHTGPVVKFIYQGDKCNKELVEWLNKFSEAVTGRITPKSEIVFDMEFDAASKFFQFFNLMCASTDFKGDFKEVCDEVCITLVYDWYRYVIKDETNGK